MRLLIAIGLALAVIMPLLATDVSAAKPMTPNNITEEINSYRRVNGLDELQTSDILLTSAGNKSDDIVERDYWAHTAPDGYGFRQVINASGYRYKIAGENLAFGYETAEEVVQAWKDSPTHNNVLLHPDFTEIGIGVTSGNFMSVDGITVVAAHLALPRPNAVVSVGNTSGVYELGNIGLKTPIKYSPVAGISVINSF